MDATVAGLIGAIIGALAVVLSTIVTYTLQAVQEHRKWLRDKRQEAYANSVKYLLRVISKRSEISMQSGQLITVLGKDVTKEWFDEMSEALTWMTILALYCPSKQRRPILEAVAKVKMTIADILTGKAPINSLLAFTLAYETIVETAVGSENTIGLFS